MVGMRALQRASIGIGFILATLQGQAGLTVGNGGDVVYCEPSALSVYKGHYSFDYLMTLKEDNSDIVTFPDWSQYRNRLQSLFATKSPDLERLFLDFTSRIPGEDPVAPDQIFLQDRLWLEAIYGLIDIKDEQAVRKLPPNCHQAGSGADELKLIQAVVRQSSESATVYNYDPALLREIKTTPLQFSYLMVHEWLWDFTSDPEIIRRLNRFLHSKTADSLSTQDFRKSILNLGLNLQPRGFTPVCLRTPTIRSVLENRMQQSCDQIDEAMRDNSELFHPIGALYQPFGMMTEALYLKFFRDNAPIESSRSFDFKGLTSLRLGDLSGLDRHKALSFRGNQIDYLFSDIFYGFFQMKILDFAGNQLKIFTPEILATMPALNQLDLSKNRLKEFSLKVPSGPTQLRTLILNENQITEFPVSLPEFAPNLVILGLASNQITQMPKLAEINPTLALIDLTNNLIRDIDPALIGSQTAAAPGRPSTRRTFMLENNQIENLTAETLTAYLSTRSKQVSLRNNQIRQLPPLTPELVQAIRDVAGLDLDLSDNPTEPIDPEWIRPVCELCKPEFTGIFFPVSLNFSRNGEGTNRNLTPANCECAKLTVKAP